MQWQREFPFLLTMTFITSIYYIHGKLNEGLKYIIISESMGILSFHTKTEPDKLKLVVIVMRITGGTLKKRKISIHSTRGIRPTSSKVREALFSMIGQELDGVSFLDAFGGSGIMGIEAYSRGALVTICENRKSAVRGIKRTIKEQGLDISIVCGSVAQVLDRKWDLVFMDPPYHFAPSFWLEQAASKVQETLIFEHSAKTKMPLRVHELYQIKSKRYGDSMLTFYEPANGKGS